MRIKVIAIVSLVMAYVILISTFSGYGFNSFDTSSEKMTYIDSYSGEIDHGVLTTKVRAKIIGKSSVTSVKIKMELQKLTSGNYSTIETWEQTVNSSVGSMEESKITNPLSTYRLKATVTAYSGSNSESKTFYAYSS